MIGKNKFPSNKEDWNEFVKNNKSIALNILHVSYNTEEMRHRYKSKHNLKRKNQVILDQIIKSRNDIKT